MMKGKIVLCGLTIYESEDKENKEKAKHLHITK